MLIKLIVKWEYFLMLNNLKIKERENMIKYKKKLMNKEELKNKNF